MQIHLKISNILKISYAQKTKPTAVIETTT